MSEEKDDKAATIEVEVDDEDVIEITEDEDDDDDDDDDEEGNASSVPAWALPLVAYVPFLTIKCPFGNLHWAWSRLCTCGFGVTVNPEEEDGWHGGVYDLKLGNELQPCAHCYEEHSSTNHQWSLTDEEEHILQAWRMYRAEMLEPFGEKTPFRWEIHVDLNGLKTSLISRTQGLSDLTGSRGMFADSKRGLKDPKPN